MPNQNARRLRNNMTDAERPLWRFLRQRQVNGLRFRRQVPIDHYIVDFACLEARLIIEVDGGQHADSETDKKRDAYLHSQGFRVLRLWNNDVSSNREGVYRVIVETLEMGS
ncbi:MAG TPA: endonuclease domain-containing protein [Dongiaceae bacterium]